MIIKLPTIKRERSAEGQIVKKHGELTVKIDTSFLAHLKWEEHFQESMKIDLTTYTERVQGWILKPELAKAQLLGMLKLLYCYVNSDELPTFKDFCALFDYEIADEIIKKISTIIEEVGKTASKNL